MYIMSKLSLAASIILVATFVAEKYGILEMRYVVIIAIVMVAIQATLLAIVMATMISKYRNISGVKMTRYQFDDRFIKEDDYILPEHVSTTNPRKSAIFKVLLKIKYTDDPPGIVISKKGFASIESDKNTDKKTDKKNLVINVNSGIADDSLLLDADILVKPGEEINLQLKKDTLVKSFFLGEFYIP
jgi:hypothetical protein